MDASRLTSGAIVAGISALLILIGIFFLDWYSANQTALGGDLGTLPPANKGAWSGAGFFGALADLIILAAALSALALVVMTARGPSVPEVLVPRLLLLAVIAALMVILRMLFPADDNLEVGIWLTLVGAFGLVAGLVLLRNEQLAERRPRRARPTAS